MGGYLGDKAAHRFPNHGRIVVCQFSVASGIPFTILVLKVRRQRTEPDPRAWDCTYRAGTARWCGCRSACSRSGWMAIGCTSCCLRQHTSLRAAQTMSTSASCTRASAETIQLELQEAELPSLEIGCCSAMM